MASGVYQITCFATGKRYIVSEETKQRLSVSLKGRQKSTEHRQRISEAQRGRPGPFKGKKHTEEARAKMRAAKVASWG